MSGGRGHVAAGNIIVRTQGSTNAIEKILNLYSFENEGAQQLKHFDQKHPFLGFFTSGNHPAKSATRHAG